MKISKVVMPLVCLCTLTACGSKVTKEEFLKLAQEIPDHQYDIISVTYVYKSGDSNTVLETENTFTLRDDYEELKKSYFDKKYFYKAEKDINNYYLLYEAERSILMYGADVGFEYYEGKDKEIDKDADVKWEVNYYTTPFKVVGSYNSTFNNKETGISGCRKYEIEYIFNRYGYLTFLETDFRDERTEDKDGLKTVEKDKTYEKITITYKDVND